MTGSSEGKLVGATLRCYPARWRQRHGDEAAELATLLIRDGRSHTWVACSYLAGAARAWLTVRPRRSPSTVAVALLAAICLLGFSAALVAGTASAKAGTTRAPAPGVSPVVPRQCPLLPTADHWWQNIQGVAHDRAC